jgi:hypothetical protein
MGLSPKQQRDLADSIRKAKEIKNDVELIAWIVDCEEKQSYYLELGVELRCILREKKDSQRK